ncbi:MAG: PEGA domain-containing protein [Patescibacteria group bacterium]
MNKVRTVLLIILGIGVLIGLVFFLLGYFQPKGAGLTIEANPLASVYIDGEQVGRTPFETTRNPGEITVKLVPEANGTPLAPFETRLTLVSGIKTILRRDLGETEEASAGETISFEKVGGKEASIAIVSVPDAAQISIDGAIRAFAPYKTSSLVAGEHQIVVSAPRYKDRAFAIRTLAGYKLTAVVKLAETGEEVKEEQPQEEKQTLVEILPTPTGFLRVRDKAGTTGVEVGQVKPGQRFVFLEEDETTGWYKIEYEKGKEGWVSNQYAKKVEGTLTAP